MVHWSNYDSSKFLKAVDLDGGEKRVKIKSVTEEVVGPDKGVKPVLRFTNIDRGLVLNDANRRILWDAFGADTDGCIGKVVVLFSTMVDFRGRMVPGLRIRIPPPKEGNGQAAAKPKPKPPVSDPELDEPPAKPAARPSLAEELDDEIDFN
jgi:hypothetical protein